MYSVKLPEFRVSVENIISRCYINKHPTISVWYGEWIFNVDGCLFIYLLTPVCVCVCSSSPESIREARVCRLQFHSSIAHTNGELTAKLCIRINLIHLCLLL